jgi:hypothetical protein
MSRRFVIEAVMLAIYSELMAPKAAIEYIVPYSTIMELYELHHSPDPIINNADEDRLVKERMEQLIAYLELPFHRKKLERSLHIPWSRNVSILFSQNIKWTIVNALEQEQYGEYFDPIETELILVAEREKAPVLTDQIEFISKIVEGQVHVQVFDIADFQFAIEGKFSV